MKALTLYQPWASLIQLNIKTIETRSWATKYRGPLAIHAAKTDFHLHGHEGNPAACHGQALAAACQHPGRNQWTLGVNNTHPFPLGAIVATCELVNCAPIGGPEDFRTGIFEGDDGDFPGRTVVVHHPGLGAGNLPMVDALIIDSPETGARSVTDQLPYGDFAPGRYAWLLTDIKPVDPPVPAKGHQGLWEWT
jgi:hypothetical protein